MNCIESKCAAHHDHFGPDIVKGDAARMQNATHHSNTEAPTSVRTVETHGCRRWLERLPTSGEHPLRRYANVSRDDDAARNSCPSLSPIRLPHCPGVPPDQMCERHAGSLSVVPSPSYELRRSSVGKMTVRKPSPPAHIPSSLLTFRERPHRIDPDEEAMMEFFSISEPPLWGFSAPTSGQNPLEDCVEASCRAGEDEGHCSKSSSGDSVIDVEAALAFQRNGARRSRQAGPGYERPLSPAVPKESYLFC
ncbi:uncharacterized protein TEOVI_000812100 [Trypanosoma equiperdum]|uniref:Uncharacterized protein n=2 Tax=Trypanozoon TaxID=39700 RepID=Q583T4_TRYB2|nr:hypothetical protein, conserved [Trypanosoma brucei brucei TREU927]AAX80473.1 hypothetical protein, conserved [Trypanosoma brucei]AAZ11633.1 hypothetical protein, conserved [Trypanosoma brucei brucei TREU927]SCU65749.1 hypothetical protein, conserved [Trypanosoma equiperdum]